MFFEEENIFLSWSMVQLNVCVSSILWHSVFTAGPGPRAWGWQYWLWFPTYVNTYFMAELWEWGRGEIGEWNRTCFLSCIDTAQRDSCCIPKQTWISCIVHAVWLRLCGCKWLKKDHFVWAACACVGVKCDIRISECSAAHVELRSTSWGMVKCFGKVLVFLFTLPWGWRRGSAWVNRIQTEVSLGLTESCILTDNETKMPDSSA